MKYQPMKRLTITLLAAGLATLILASSAEAGAVATSGVGPGLINAGFRVKTATTQAQREQLRTMPEGTFTTVQQGGRTYYLYADKQTGQVYAGDYYAYRQYCRYAEMQRDRKAGAFVIDVKPRNAPVIKVWHDWSPFQQW